MLTIRSSQVSAFTAAKTQEFAATLVNHIECAFPAEIARRGRGGIQELVGRTLDRAREHRINTSGAVVTFLELLLQFGETFDESPDGERAQEILEDPEFPGQIKIELLVECLTSRSGGRRIDQAN